MQNSPTVQGEPESFMAWWLSFQGQVRRCIARYLLSRGDVAMVRGALFNACDVCQPLVRFQFVDSVWEFNRIVPRVLKGE